MNDSKFVAQGKHCHIECIHLHYTEKCKFDIIFACERWNISLTRHLTDSEKWHLMGRTEGGLYVSKLINIAWKSGVYNTRYNVFYLSLKSCKKQHKHYLTLASYYISYFLI